MFISLFFVVLAFVQGSPLPDVDARKPMPRFERIVIDADFPDAYQVEIADIDGDDRPDIVALGGGTVAWYQSPSWKKRIITGPDMTPGVISSASRDLDGDGRPEIAIAYDFEMNRPRRGKLLLAVQGETIDDPWTTRPIADVGSIHRVRWVDLERDDRPELLVAPIFGPDAKPPTYDQDPAEVLVFKTGNNPKSGHWERFSTGVKRPVIHAIQTFDADHGPGGFLAAHNLGVDLFRGVPGGGFEPNSISHVPGKVGDAPARGASEVQFGSLQNMINTENGNITQLDFLVTVEPWHGNEVVVWNDQHPLTLDFGDRTVLDDTLDEGHALGAADVDRDGDAEIFAGHRGEDHRISGYNFDGKTWNRTVIDREIAAQDLRIGDLTGDLMPDVVAVGGSTHNVILYRQRAVHE